VGFLALVLLFPAGILAVTYGFTLAYVPTAVFLRIYAVRFLERMKGIQDEPATII